MNHHLRAIQVFGKVVESGSFTAAAELLNMPKSTVSKLIQQLENHLKVKLLHRTTRRLTLTMEGHAYYERTNRLLHELEDIESYVSHEQRVPRGLLRINIASAIANHILIPQLADFQQKYPLIQLDLGVTDSNIDLVSENVDCVIRGGQLTDLSLVARKIAEFPVITCATPAYLREYGTPTSPDCLDQNHRLIYYRSGRGNNKIKPMRFTHQDHSIEIKRQACLTVSDSTAFSHAVRSGIGIAQLPKFLVEKELTSGQLQQILPMWQSNPIPLYIIYTPNRYLSGRLQAFTAWITELFVQNDHCPHV
ncbi:LysR family transcriptional regulator [Aliidiomarina quisquiliarum]|uniref:LysR family transcriptional regulator n=1 Tax=Aliidiomarina quisquiliarum TaxID=2938947 RepID=UPI00208F677F|nr:LysR family transcriptional regulator [Aliidiomarina quisquiliarum]MCO4320804.1 LysR family transcriptional regulator [Aliidiomarina quisquiliarum]